MYKHSFTYTIIEDYVEVDAQTKKLVKSILLKEDKYIPGMNFTSFFDKHEILNKLIVNKLGHIFKSFSLTLDHSWIQKYSKYGYHSIHTHHPKHKSFVWFIQGNKNSSPISFFDVGYPYVDVNKPKDFKFKPGTFLLFPGYMPHEVKPNRTDNRLIVSGNLV